MKKKTPSVLTLIALSLLLIASSSCQEQANMSDNKQVRLVASQNIELKEQLKEKDAEIQKQKDLLAQCQKKNEKLKAQAGDAATAFVMMTLETTKPLQEEIQTLKARIKELEAQLNK